MIKGIITLRKLSFYLSLLALPVYVHAQDITLKKNDFFAKSTEKLGTMFVIGQTQNTPNQNSDIAGRWISKMDGAKVWRYEIFAPGAGAIDVYFDQISLPEHAAMYLRSNDGSKVSGPFFQSDIHSKEFATGIVPGERAFLEVFFPQGNTDNFFLSVSEIGYLSADALKLTQKDAIDYLSSDVCQVNVNCSEGANWQNQKRSVVKIKVKDGNDVGLCTGALINNTAQDCKNYVLTAQHCGAGATDLNFNQWVFYFNFQTPACSNPASASTFDDQVVGGAIKRAASGTSSNINFSDFLLIEMNATIPASFNPFYAGWDRNNVTSNSGVSIHHPNGDVKKISTYNSSLANASWGSTPSTHWRVSWASTTNGHGVTEPGSSGSPIFNSVGRIIGDLSGGGSLCTSTSSPDLYGKLSYSWSSVGSSSQTQLKSWLDPSNSNVNAIDGRNACTSATAAPVVDFVSDQNFIVPNTLVKFISTATNSPTSYTWSLSPSSGFIYNMGSSSAPHPGIRFFTPGCYTVTLTASNSAGSDTETKTGFICVGTAGISEMELNTIKLFPNPASDYLMFDAPQNWDGNYQILSMTGQTLIASKSNSNQINIQTLSSGNYVLKLNIQGKILTQIFVKNE